MIFMENIEENVLLLQLVMNCQHGVLQLAKVQIAQKEKLRLVIN